MDRTDKIFTALCLCGLVAFLLWRKCVCAIVPGEINTSVAPSIASGPSYLVSNLPIVRPFDDAAPAVSEAF